MNNGFKAYHWDSIRVFEQFTYTILTGYLILAMLSLSSLYSVIVLLLAKHIFKALFVLGGAGYLNFVIALKYVDFMRNTKRLPNHWTLYENWKWVKMFMVTSAIISIALMFPKLMNFLSIVAFFELITIEPYAKHVQDEADRENAERYADSLIPSTYAPAYHKSTSAPARNAVPARKEPAQTKTVTSEKKPAKAQIQRVLDDFNLEVSYFLNDKYEEAINGRTSEYHDATDYEISEQNHASDTIYAPYDGTLPEFELSFDEQKNEIEVVSTALGAGLDSYPLKKGVNLYIESDAHWFIADNSAWDILSELDNLL